MPLDRPVRRISRTDDVKFNIMPPNSARDRDDQGDYDNHDHQHYHKMFPQALANSEARPKIFPPVRAGFRRMPKCFCTVNTSRSGVQPSDFSQMPAALPPI